MSVRKRSTMVAVVALGLVAVTPLTSVNAAEPASVRAESALLVTGDRIDVRTTGDGRRTASVLPAAETGIGRVLVHLNVGRKSYEVPAAALPYLGRGLDWSLFDIDEVLRARSFTKDTAEEFGANLVRKFLDDRK